MVIALLISFFLSLVLPVAGFYWFVYRPLKMRQAWVCQQLAAALTDLADERRLRADMVKWIDIETGKFPFIGKALKQRIDERLEVLRQLRQLREHMDVTVTLKI